MPHVFERRDGMRGMERRHRKDILRFEDTKLHRSGNHHPIVARARRLEGGQLSPVRKGMGSAWRTGGTISTNCTSDTVFALV